MSQNGVFLLLTAGLLGAVGGNARADILPFTGFQGASVSVNVDANENRFTFHVLDDEMAVQVSDDRDGLDLLTAVFTAELHDLELEIVNGPIEFVTTVGFEEIPLVLRIDVLNFDFATLSAVVGVEGNVVTLQNFTYESTFVGSLIVGGVEAPVNSQRFQGGLAADFLVTPEGVQISNIDVSTGQIGDVQVDGVLYTIQSTRLRLDRVTFGNVNVIPEPSPALLVSFGLGILGYARTQRRSRVRSRRQFSGLGTAGCEMGVSQRAG